MADIKQAIATLIDSLGTRWLWLPIFFGCSVLASFAFAIMLGWFGVFLPHIPSIIFIILEARRQKRLPIPSDAWETGDIEQLVKDYAEEQNRIKAEKNKA